MTVVPIKKLEYTLEAISPEQLARVWDMIESDVIVVKVRSQGTWNEKHVFAAVFARQAILQICFWGGEYVGFVVSVPHVDVYNGEQSLIVWCCFARKSGALEWGMEQVFRNAKDAGFKSIKMQSPRRGWIRKLKNYGFRVRDYVLEKEL